MIVEKAVDGDDGWCGHAHKLAWFVFVSSLLIISDDVAFSLSFGQYNVRWNHLSFAIFSVLMAACYNKQILIWQTDVLRFVLIIVGFCLINWISTGCNFTQRGFMIAGLLTINCVASLMFALVIVRERWEARAICIILWGAAVAIMWGIAQFILGALGFSGVLISQWWIPGKLPRVNGFTLEPSYFGTYLVSMYVLWWEFRKYSREGSGYCDKIIKYLLFISLILSGSRMSLLAFFLYVSIRNIRMLPCYIIIFACLFLFAKCWFDAETNDFLVGSGLGNSQATSINIRKEQFLDTVEVWRESPIIGVGLGNVGLNIAEKNGIDWIQRFQEDGSKIEALNITAEAAAGVGIMGIVFVLLTPLLALSVWIRNFRENGDPMVRASAASVVALMGMLNLNQGLNRSYMWVLIGLFLGCYYIDQMRCDQKK